MKTEKSTTLVYDLSCFESTLVRRNEGVSQGKKESSGRQMCHKLLSMVEAWGEYTDA